MDKIEKLLRKVTFKNRQRLIEILELLAAGNKRLNVLKIKNTDFYCLRAGRFRIIFHYESKEVIIDSVKLRNESTYKGL